MSKNIRFYAHKDGKWIKCAPLLKEPKLSELYDVINILDKRYSRKHWAFPADIKPEDFPELLEMEKIMLKHVEHYRNDFYIHDIYGYLKGDKKAIWCLRDTGTHYINMLDNFNHEHTDGYKYYLKSNKHLYLIDNGKIKKINLQKAQSLLEEKMNVAAA
ncbi:hypothetical protein ABWK22_02420 [Gottfriedia acidiceleris]|uniref:hypothetical protein n=1 Tax=Gottfriedia acidiceleris TaxID=371036 RepID=UPI003391931C